jgi:hypothetical protein
MSHFAKLVVFSLVLYPLAVSAQFFNDFDQPPHDYWTAEMHDPMTELLRSVDAGDVNLGHDPGLPLVRRLLAELEIPVDSQTLVFSRTSLQRGVVSPGNPRAIYFNEETYLGWMPGGRVEIASSDPERGAVFFFQRELERRDGPLFVRDKVCIQCHAGSATNFLPGLLGKSVFPDGRGRSLKSIDSFERVGHEVPLRERWGGWYVSGAHDGLRHMGNSLAKRGAGGVELIREAKADLGKLFDQSKYPVGGSDVIALLVLDHQISMHFELMEAHYIARQALADLGAEAKPIPAEVAAEIDSAAERVVGYLLFQNEADLGETAVGGAESFRKTFLANRRVDTEGRSLKDFQLQGQLFKHRCSYMIYSKSFTGLPKVLKRAIYRRLKEVLGAEEAVDGYGYLADAERAAILEILKATLPGFVA